MQQRHKSLMTSSPLPPLLPVRERSRLPALPPPPAPAGLSTIALGAAEEPWINDDRRFNDPKQDNHRPDLLPSWRQTGSPPGAQQLFNTLSSATTAHNQNAQQQQQTVQAREMRGNFRDNAPDSGIGLQPNEEGGEEEDASQLMTSTGSGGVWERLLLEENDSQKEQNLQSINQTSSRPLQKNYSPLKQVHHCHHGHCYYSSEPDLTKNADYNLYF